LRNRSTGKVVIVDGYKKRYDLMSGRIWKWADVMKHLDCEVYMKMISLTYDVFGTKGEPSNWTANDIRDFEVRLRAHLKKYYTGVRLLGYAWVGEVQPGSKHYHYHLVLATDKKLHFANGVIARLWGKGFIKLTVARSPFYLVSYTKKKDQKDYFYFPWGARGFAVWISSDVLSDGKNSKRLLRANCLKEWQIKFLVANMTGDDVLDSLDLLKEAEPPPNGWEWVGSWVKLELAEEKVKELEAELSPAF
jgi:hypothetical protein